MIFLPMKRIFIPRVTNPLEKILISHMGLEKISPCHMGLEKISICHMGLKSPSQTVTTAAACHEDRSATVYVAVVTVVTNTVNNSYTLWIDKKTKLKISRTRYTP